MFHWTLVGLQTNVSISVSCSLSAPARPPTFTLHPSTSPSFPKLVSFVIAFVKELRLASGNGKQGSIEIAEWFDRQNAAGWEDVLQTKRGCDVISLAHFLPHQVTITTPHACILQPSQPWSQQPCSLGPFTVGSLLVVTTCMVSTLAHQKSMLCICM